MEQYLKLNRLVKKEVLELIEGLYKSKIKGRGIEFDSLREYTERDDAKLIDWKVFSRTQQLFVKNFKEYKQLDLFFWLDVTFFAFCSFEPVSIIRKIYEIFFFLSQAAEHDKDKVSVALISYPLNPSFKIFLKESGKIIHLKVHKEILKNLNFYGQNWKKLTFAVKYKELYPLIEKFCDYAYTLFPKGSLIFFLNAFPFNINEFPLRSIKPLAQKHNLIWINILESFVEKKDGFFSLDIKKIYTWNNNFVDFENFNWEKCYQAAEKSFLEFKKQLLKYEIKTELFYTNLDTLKQLIWILK